MKAANKELKGMMKTVKLEDIDVCYLPFSRLTLTRFLMLSVFAPYMHFQFVAYFPVWLMLHLNLYLLWSIEHARWDDGSYGCKQWNTRNSWQKLQRPWWYRWGRTYGRYGSIILAVRFLFDNNLQTPYIFSNCIDCYKAYEEEQTHFSLCCPHFVSWKMQSSMLWKLTWTLNRSQSHLTSNQTKNLNSTYLLHQLAMQQSQQTSSR